MLPLRKYFTRWAYALDRLLCTRLSIDSDTISIGEYFIYAVAYVIKSLIFEISCSDAMIVTSLDTFTSFMAGIIIFGILGNLAHETGATDITAVVQGGTGLAFVSYPDAISKFDFWPQAFAVNFFFMLFVLGIGCVIGAQVCVTSLLRDRFKSPNRLWLMIGMGFGQFLLGCLFLTPVSEALSADRYRFLALTD